MQVWICIYDISAGKGVQCIDLMYTYVNLYIYPSCKYIYIYICIYNIPLYTYVLCMRAICAFNLKDLNIAKILYPLI